MQNLPIKSQNILSVEDWETLKRAKHAMENIGPLMKGLNQIGNVLETGIEKIPPKRQRQLQDVVQKTLLKIIQSNLITMKKGKAFKKPGDNTFKAIITSSGILGGFMGTPAFVVDLAITTKLMMRSILDIARSEGEDIHTFDTQLAAMQVFALGGRSKHDDGLETTYYTIRIAMKSAVKGASEYLAKGGLSQGIEVLLGQGIANPLVKLISAITSRFGVQVSEKLVAQAMPVIGAAGGGSINFLFIQHFQSMAHAHFAIRRLERTYGEDLVHKTYNEIGVG